MRKSYSVISAHFVTRLFIPDRAESTCDPDTRVRHEKRCVGVKCIDRKNVVPLILPAARETERGLITLSDAAARGEIIGIAYTVLTPDMTTRQGWFGAANSNVPLAYFGVQRLSEMLLWPDDEWPSRR